MCPIEFITHMYNSSITTKAFKERNYILAQAQIWIYIKTNHWNPPGKITWLTPQRVMPSTWENSKYAYKLATKWCNIWHNCCWNNKRGAGEWQRSTPTDLTAGSTVHFCQKTICCSSWVLEVNRNWKTYPLPRLGVGFYTIYMSLQQLLGFCNMWFRSYVKYILSNLVHNSNIKSLIYPFYPPCPEWSLTYRNMALLCYLAATLESWPVLTNHSVPTFPETG